MSSDDYGSRRAPAFLTHGDGKVGRPAARIALNGEDPRETEPSSWLMKLEPAVTAAQAAREWNSGEPRWLEEIAGLLVQLPYGDMIEYAEGTAGDPAKIFAWAQAKVREAGDAV